ncbi:hypothetical protein JCM16303_005802 [Sporobolomyces ruberrimus]
MIQDQTFITGISTSVARTILTFAVLSPQHPARLVGAHKPLFKRLLNTLQDFASQLCQPLYAQGLSRNIQAGSALAFNLIHNAGGRKGLAAVWGSIAVPQGVWDQANELGYFDHQAWLCGNGTTWRADGSRGHA